MVLGLVLVIFFFIVILVILNVVGERIFIFFGVFWVIVFFMRLSWNLGWFNFFGVFIFV